MASVIIISCGILYGTYTLSKFKRNAEESIESVTSQTQLLFDNLLDSMNQISLMPLLNPRVYQTLRKKYDNNTTLFEKYEDQDIIASHMYNSAYYFDKRISSITYIPLSSNLVAYKNKTGATPNLKDVKKQKWILNLMEYQKDFSFFVLESDSIYPNNAETFCFARLIKDSSTDEILGVIRVDVPLNQVKEIWDNAKLTEDFGIQFISRETGDTILSDLMSKETTTYLNINSSSQVYKYTLICLVPTSYLYDGIGKVVMTILVITFILIGLTFYVADVLSKKTMKPIKHLNKCMKEVEKGNLSVRAKTSVGGEFGQICQSFNHMAIETEELINKIYIGEEEKRKAEFQALQAQISPHFLLNTINTIRWMAMLQGSKPIASALDNLSNILSFTFRDTREKITINDEVKQINHYIEILKLRYPNRFDFTINVDSNVGECLTLKYLLQPFIENSIFHGFQDIEYEGIVIVDIKKQGEVIHYEIWDNGTGISQQDQKKVLENGHNKHKGFNNIGISNVMKRIARAYGDKYGVTIDSKVHEFTKINITIPVEQ